jgi:DNA-binding PadR family transcriptional regulator
MPSRGLSISDYTVLGVIAREGPCTTYNVMMDMAASPSSFYRKRASSTYSVVQRLDSQGLIKALDEEPGPRGERQLAVTPEGLRALKEWLCRIPVAEAAYSNDLIRLRVNFLIVLSPSEREALVDQAIDSLKILLSDSEGELEKRKDPIRYATLLGLIYETRARLEWLAEVKRVLPTFPAGKPAAVDA